MNSYGEAFLKSMNINAPAILMWQPGSPQDSGGSNSHGCAEKDA